jgi:hypothetical protein
VGTVPLANTNWPTTIIDLYAADDVGITNGQATGIAELPNGFIQGATYLASFVDNGPADRDARPGYFDFDIRQIALADVRLTATANYLNGPATNASTIVVTSPFAEPTARLTSSAPALKISRSDHQLTISWPTGAVGFVLESTNALPSVPTGQPWPTIVGTANPTLITIPSGAGAVFYRLRKP